MWLRVPNTHIALNLDRTGVFIVENGQKQLGYVILMRQYKNGLLMILLVKRRDYKMRHKHFNMFISFIIITLLPKAIRNISEEKKLQKKRYSASTS